MGTSDTTPSDAPTWSADIQPIFARSCAGCHQEGQIGGFPLQTWAEASVLGSAIAQTVLSGEMPPWRATDGCNDYLEDISLSDEERETIAAWVEAGTPEGEAATASATVELGVGELERIDGVLEMPEIYTPTDEPDDYRCFIVPWPLDEDAYVTGYRVVPGNPELVHHVVVYRAPGELAAEFEAQDAADPGAGYTCFGGPGVVSDEDADWLGGWAPGGGTNVLPEGHGIQIAHDELIILQVHYYTAGSSGTDLSWVEFMVEDSVEHPSWVQPYADPNWLDGGNMVIPAGTEATHGYDYELITALNLHTANLHMHRFGTSARMSVKRADGSEACLLEIDEWDFDWQRTYRFTDVVLAEEGDTLSLSCTWENTTDSDIDWGDGTGDEMCLSTMLMSLP